MAILNKIFEKLETANHISNVSIENDSEIHFIAFKNDIIIKVDECKQTYKYISGGTPQQRSAIDEVLRNNVSA